MASYSVGRCWSLCNVGWPSLQCLSGTKHSRQNLSDISSNERIEFFLKLLSVVSAAIYFLKDQWWSSIVYFLCRHSLTSSGTMQREHRLFNQESRCVFSQCLHVNTFAIQKLVHFYCMRRWFRPPKEKKTGILIYNLIWWQHWCPTWYSYLYYLRRWSEWNMLMRLSVIQSMSTP